MFAPIQTQCFKAYDIRGQVPSQLNDDIAYRIGRALVLELNGKGAFVVGRDMRPESPGLAAALTRGIVDAGAEVIYIGLWYRRSSLCHQPLSGRWWHHGYRQS